MIASERDTVVMLTGGCVCGNVRYSTDSFPVRITACHCTWCQRRTGTAFGTECVFPNSSVIISGASLSSYRHHSDLSGRWIEQYFCSSCGSNVGLRLEAVPELRSLALGSFDDIASIESADIPLRHVFARSRVSVSVIPGDAESHEMHFRN